MRPSTAALTLTLIACNVRIPTLDASTANEHYILEETARFAEKLHKPEIKGAIVKYTLVVPAGTQGCPADAPNGCTAAGWYDPPVAYYWQEFVNREENTPLTLSTLAAHEVCHSVSPAHDQLHQNCMLNMGIR